MFVALSASHPDPMYKQVTDQLKDAIASGDLKPNDRLPSVRELSEALNVSAITIKRAYADLETDGTSSRAPGSARLSRRSSPMRSARASWRKCGTSFAGLSARARSSASRPTRLSVSRREVEGD